MVLSMAETRGDDEGNNGGVQDASASRAPGMFFLFFFSPTDI